MLMDRVVGLLPWVGWGLTAGLFTATVASQTVAVSRAPEIRLVGEEVVLPIITLRGFPFVQGAVAGI